MNDLVHGLEALIAKVEFALEGRYVGDTGATENNLLSMAADHLRLIAQGVKGGHLTGGGDDGGGQPELLCQLSRFESYLDAIVTLIAVRYPENHREQARLEYLKQVQGNTAELFDACDGGKWYEAIVSDRQEARHGR